MTVFHKSIKIVLLTLFIITLNIGVLAEPINGPRLVSQKGHLIIKSGYNRNITLETNGDASFINIGSHNMQQLLEVVTNSSSKFYEKLIENLYYSSSSAKIRLAFDGPNGILKRLLALETARPETNITLSQRAVTRLQFFRIKRRINLLERKVTQLTTLINKDDCLSTPCQNGGTCRDNLNGYMCRCPRNWEGADCSRDVNECSNFAGTDLGCQNGATCVNKPGSYECQCATGWFGVHCTKRSLDCTTGSNAEVCDHGTCITQNSALGIKCICDQGWKTNGISPACSVDINECEGNVHPCSVNPRVPCINVPGAFYCGSCPSGFTGNGYQCTDIDECLFDNGGCSKTPLVQCTNTYGSRTCGPCPPGYEGNGISCSFSGICAINNGGCHQLAICSSNPMISSTYVQCTCRPGYTGTGVGLDGCTIYNAGNTDLARPSESLCTPNPCVHGVCHVMHNRFMCVCPPKYTGTLCDIVRDPCDPQPCGNGGTCIADMATTAYRCECTSHFTGSTCQTQAATCGGVLTAQEGSIIHPDTNNTEYNHNARCAWVIITAPKKVLHITFSRFSLEQSAECLYDWLQIHDGRNSASRMIGRYCGNNLPNAGNIISTQNTLYFWFRSDHTVAQNGFSLHWTSINPVCGGTIQTSTFGVIHSPGSPGKYPPNRDCYWSIIAPPNKKIQLHFYTLQIEAHPDCQYDYLEIYNGLNKNNHLIERYCSSSHPPPLLTPGPEATLYFHTDAFSNDYGFQISYAVVEGVPGCGGLFTQDSGEITPPGKTGQYTNNINCEYKIQLRPGDRIKLTFLSFEVEHSSSCYFDYVAVYDGDSTESALISRYCGNEIPAPITSTGNNMVIVFNSDYTVSQGGFRIQYELVCRKVFTELTGSIESPGYPFSYPVERKCSYLISLPLKKVIKLSFVVFDIEETSFPLCVFDNVKVYDGDNENSTLFGQFCGNTQSTPADIVSTHNYLYLEFTSDSSIIGLGFVANYTSLDIDCGGIVKQSPGTIEFPASDAGDDYNTNRRNCRWILSAPAGYIIQLRWISFDLELLSNCFGDYVEIYENNTSTETSEKFGRYCGSTAPPSMTSTNNMMTIIFKSDDSAQSDGFSLTYTYTDATKVCGGTYLSSSGTITTPGWPNNYPTHKDCTWVIRVPNGQQIMLNVTDFDIEYHSQCLGDRLEIKNGGYVGAPLIGRYCGTNITRIIPSMTNSLYIRFYSDSSISGSGFKMTWDSTSTGCGGVLTSSHGSFVSPNYPDRYGHNAECYWKISTSVGSTIELSFSDLDLEESPTCQFDYIVIYDGVDDSQGSLGRFCSKHFQIGHITSSTNHVFIKFRSDGFTAGYGFMINYITDCNRNITGFSGVIESPNFPNPYPDWVNCTWHINVPPGNKINVTFSHFEMGTMPEIFQDPAGPFATYLDSFNSCKNDYIQMKDGSVHSEYKKHCGSNLPPKFVTTDNNFFLHLYANHVHRLSGFRLEWVLDGCGGHLTRPFDTISSPGYPRAHSIETECNWIIEVDPDKAIELQINDIDMELSTVCDDDSLSIYNGQSEESHLLTKICHSQNDTHILTSTGNTMFLKYIVTDYKVPGRGFFASYKSIQTPCGGKFSGHNAAIMTPNYPKNYGSNLNCLWHLEVPETHLINFTFTDFDINSQLSNNRCIDYINVFDADKPIKPLLSTYCGKGRPQAIFSSSNNLLVQLVTTTGNAKGFKANFEMVCGGRIVTGNEGVLNSLSWLPPGDLAIYSCQWTIIGERPDQRVAFTVTHLEMSVNCSDQSVAVYNGDSVEAPIIGTYCGSRIPPTITSLGNALTITVNSTYHILGMFSAHYSVLSTACGGTLTSEEGSFTSPLYPDSYPLNAECIWTLNTAPGNQLSLVFKEFDLESSDNCDDDYVEIREKDGVGKIIGIYCGNNVPTNVTVAHNLWIKFRSSEIGTASGFVAEYSFVHGNVFEGLEMGQIASPLYPKLYFQTSEVSWKIIVEFNSIIVFTFREFQIEVYYDSCYQYLAIYDGPDESYPELIKACGRTIPESVRTTSDTAFIVFKTTPFRRGTLFLMDWISETKQSPKYIDDRTLTCGETGIVFVSPSNARSIQSPGYPHGYNNNLNCEWILETDTHNHLEVELIDVSFEDSTDCTLDRLEIYSGVKGTQNWKKIQNNICHANDSTRPPISGSNLMKINFISDISANISGFSLKVNSVCGNSMSESSAVLKPTRRNTTSGYLYRMVSTLLDCQWDVTVKPGRKIKVEFLFFNITNTNENTCNNYIMLRNGGTEESPLLGEGKYCGPSAPTQELLTTGNQLFIRYKGLHSTLFNAEQHAFVLKYSEQSIECGQRILLTHDDKKVNISSPNYPNIPNPHSECIWVIMAPLGERLRLDFIGRFDFSTNRDCTDDFVEVRDGATEDSTSLGKFCDKIPGTIKTSGNFMFVKFSTDITDPKNGFQATIDIDLCGGTFQVGAGRIESPDFLSMSVKPQDIECEWKIIGLTGHSLWINVLSVSLAYTSDCEEASIEIFDVLQYNNTITSISNKLCGDRAKTYRTSSNMAVVKFKIAKNTPKTASHQFSITFNSSIDTCGGTLTAPSGYLTGPSVQFFGGYIRFCEWRIMVPKGRRIKIEFITIDTSQLSSQRLRFYNDFSYSCSIRSNSTEFIESSSNKMLVFLWTKVLPDVSQFRAKYSSDEPTICEGSIVGNEGTLVPPNSNISSYYCEYETELPPYDDTISGKQLQGRTLSMVFNNAIIGRKISTHCRYLGSRVTITGTSLIVSELCGSFPDPVTVLSPFAITTIKVTRTIMPITFSMDYKYYPCGGEVSDLDSPNILSLPVNHTGPLDCAWYITAPQQRKIELKTNKVVFNNHSCDSEFITVNTGRVPSNYLLYKICHGTMSPHSFKSQGNAIWLHYHTDSFSPLTVFDIDVTTDSLGCGGIMTKVSKVIHSPNFPEHYDSNQECLWELHADQGYKISLSFEQRFSLESSDNCSKDFVEIIDYVHGEWKSIKRLCGRNLPNTFNSTADKMRVLFRSNPTVNGDGFQARWKFICGGQFDATLMAQSIISPGFPVYGRDLNCVYTITDPDGGPILLTFDRFNLETGKNQFCQYDNVTLEEYGGLSEDSSGYYYIDEQVKKTYCGTKSPGVRRYIHGVKMTFITDSWVQRPGFQLTYKKDSCGGQVNESMEFGTSGGDTYHTGLRCVWNITAPEDKYIVVRFKKFVLEHNYRCSYDEVAIYEGHDEENRLASLCGNMTKSLPVIHSKTNKMIIIFTSDHSFEFDGFLGDILFMNGIEGGCGLHVNLTETANYDLNILNYNTLLDCSWLIKGPEDTLIQMQFTQFNVSECYNNTRSLIQRKKCECDYLEIHDGAGHHAPLIGKYCGDKLPNTIVSSSNLMWVRFVSDGTLSSTGIRSTLKSTPRLCGPARLTATNVTQELVFPTTTDGMLKRGLRCRWLLDSDRLVHVHLIGLDMEPKSSISHQCESDGLLITDIKTSSSHTDALGQDLIITGRHHSLVGSAPYDANEYLLCGSVPAFDVYSMYNDLTISLFTSSDTTAIHKKFRLEYSIPGCSRNFSGPHGRIQISHIDHVEQCTINITAPLNYTISLFISDMTLYASDCKVDFIEVRDGGKVDSPILQKYCAMTDSPLPIFSTGNNLLILMSQSSLSGIMMFDMEYTRTDKGRGCGGSMYGVKGTLNSALYPSPYRSNGYCQWDVTTPTGTVLSINFLVFDIGSASSCDVHYLELRSIDGQLLTKYCPDDEIAEYHASDNFVRIRQYSTMNNLGSGWKAAYSSQPND